MNELKKIKPSAVFTIALAANVIIQPSYPAVLMFIGFHAALCFQFYLRHVDKREEGANEIAVILDQIDKNNRAIEALNSDVESVRKDHTEAHRILEESKSLLSQNRLASALNSKTKRL